MPKKKLQKKHAVARKAKKGLVAIPHNTNYGTWTEPQVIAQVVKYDQQGIGPNDAPEGFRKVAFRYMTEDPQWDSKLTKAEAGLHLKNRSADDPGIDDLSTLLGSMGLAADSASGDPVPSLDNDDDEGDIF